MSPPQPWTRGRTPADLDLSPAVTAAMRADLPRVAQQVVDAVQPEVPSYADPFKGEMGRTIENAVTLALGGFLGLASGETADGPRPRSSRSRTRRTPWAGARRAAAGPWTRCSAPTGSAPGSPGAT